MQLRLKPRTSRNIIGRNLVIKIILIISAFFLVVFLLDRINFPTPKELIKQEIDHDKIITLK